MRTEQTANKVETLITSIRRELNLKTEQSSIKRKEVSDIQKAKINAIILKSGINPNLVCRILGVKLNFFRIK